MAAAKASGAKIKTQATGSSTKRKKPRTGAPSQHTQSSRKGKRAWRKNVDIEEVEEALEGMRAEERITGTTLQKMSDRDLFTIDVQGDPKIRKSQRFSASVLTSTKILAQRSAIPAVFSRTSTATAQTKRKNRLTSREKNRLLRIAKRLRRGPLNSFMDPTQPGGGSALAEVSAAVKASGRYDPWTEDYIPLGGEGMEEPMGMETLKRKQVKAPPVPLLKSLASSLPAVSIPHQGTSYNPPVDAHQELLRMANEEEEKRLKELEKEEEVKKKIVAAGAGKSFASVDGVPAGMMVDIESDKEEGAGEAEAEAESIVKRMPSRKTKAQRNKAALLLGEERDKVQTLEQKRLDASIYSYKRLRKTHVRTALQRSQELASKHALRLEGLKKHGLAGRKLGKHRVPEERLDVQLGEDLSESLRALKPEGNLLRDRFLRLQQQGAIEPRVPVMPTKRKRKKVEYEKHAWKRFE